MNYEVFIIFTGIVITGIFLLYFSIFKRIEKAGRKYIIAGMLVAFYIFLFDLFFALSDMQAAVWLFLLYYPFIFLCYPIVYHYLVNAANDKNQRYIVKIFNTLPLIILIINLIFYLPLNKKEKIDFINTNLAYTINEISVTIGYEIIINILFYAQVFVFIVIFIQMFVLKKKQLILNPDKEILSLPNWLLFFVSGIVLYELFVLGIGLVIHDEPQILFQTANIMLVLFLGFLGIQHDEMLIKMKLDKELNKKNKSSAPKSQNINGDEESKLIELVNEVIITNKLYLNPALKIEIVAKKIHLPVNKLSQLINSHYKVNFSQFLNKYRIEEAIGMLSDSSNQYNIQNVYPQVGFYTRSTFFRAFKSYTGKSPSEFQKTTRI